jgi:hypothetical protein
MAGVAHAQIGGGVQAGRRPCMPQNHLVSVSHPPLELLAHRPETQGQELAAVIWVIVSQMEGRLDGFCRLAGFD